MSVEFTPPQSGISRRNIGEAIRRMFGVSPSLVSEEFRVESFDSDRAKVEITCRKIVPYSDAMALINGDTPNEPVATFSMRDVSVTKDLDGEASYSNGPDVKMTLNQWRASLHGRLSNGMQCSMDSAHCASAADAVDQLFAEAASQGFYLDPREVKS